MPNQNNNTTGEEGGESTAPQADQFGVTLNTEGKEITQEETIKAGESKKGDDSKNKDGKDGDDGKTVEKTPEVLALEQKVKDYGSNLSGQNDVITKLQAKIEALEKGKDTGNDGDDKKAEPMFKDIKFSKDLTQDQRDDMTDAEVAMFDQNATMQQTINKMAEQISDGQKTVETNEKKVEDQKVEDLNSSANVEASRLATEAIKANPELAKDATELQAKIILEFNEFNNDGITPEKLAERMKKALNNVGGYTPPKEQEKKSGSNKKAVKAGGGGDTDPFGVDAIVAGVNKSNKGDYNL